MESPARLADEPTWNLVGERVALGPLHAAMLPLFVRWLNDFEVTCTLALGMRPMTREAEQAWYERASLDRGDSVQFVIYERATRRPVGTTDLRDVDHQHGTAE